MSKPTSNDTPQVPSPSLRFEGMYQAKIEDYYSYLRFYADGSVVSISTSDEPFQALALVNRSFYGSGKGRYTLNGEKLEFSVTSQVGVVDFSGTFENDKLSLTSISHINNHKATHVFRFVEIPGLEPDEVNGVTFYV